MNEDTNMVAVEEKISVESQLRIDLATLDATFHNDWDGYHAAKQSIILHLSDKLYELFAIIDAERHDNELTNRDFSQLRIEYNLQNEENTRLREALKEITKNILVIIQMPM